MGENSQIEWTDHTFNPWWGCMKVSDGCKNCYAESLDSRWHHADPHWGPGSARKQMSEAYWRQPFKWDAAAKADGIQAKVFVASMADWAESEETLKDYPSQLMVHDARLRLFQTIAVTPNLNYQMLTKRIDNVMPLLERLWDALFMHDALEDGNKEYLAQHKEAYDLLTNWLNGKPPANVWIGTSVENQDAADERIPELLKVPAKVRFLSCEPLLGPVDLNKIWIDCPECLGSASIPVDGGGVACGNCLTPYQGKVSGVHWVICGGESGHGARPMHPVWAKEIKEQCMTAHIPFFFKQWGEYKPAQFFGEETNKIWMGYEQDDKCIHTSQPRQMACYGRKVAALVKVGKKEAGAILDGREWKEFPA